MSKSESRILSEIRLELPVQAGALVFRNNTGAYKTEAGHYVRYGVGETGGSDLIGVTPVKVTQEMVGKTVGVFTAIEVKNRTGRTSQRQENFIAAIKKIGGIAGVARSVADAVRIIASYEPK